MNNDFSLQLKQARAETGLSQQALADRTLIPRRTIQDWEGGQRTPPPYVQRFVLNELASLKKVKIVRVELYGTDEDIKAHLEKLQDSGASLQGYIKERIRADMNR